ncbi:MAG: UvrD-helicase domain-containing protein, partial [Clostridia bacterium]|nr:UvrD-helicase domain-containing protein [Clostridia bacterium]
TEGAVLVIAGAGSGKTRVLTSRIAHIVIDMGVPARNILAITFTNKAADEMKERLTKIVGDVSEMWVCTIHSMCVRILRSTAQRIGYNNNFTIYSETDKDKVLKRLITSLTLDAETFLKPVKSYISTCKNKDMSIEDFRREYSFLKDLGSYAKIMEAYDEELKRSNAFDFDDLLIKAYRVLAENRDVLKRFSDDFRYIHVDEFQDTNTVQYNIIKLLSVVHGNVFAVGDDDQSIYGWRGADIKNILNFEKDFKDAKKYKLERNYRSTKRILELANMIIANNTVRNDKVLWTDNEDGTKAEFYAADEESGEAQYTAIQIRRLVERGYKYSDCAVLMRINALSRSYEQEFMKYGIPCKVFGGFKFFERKEIKDITAYLRILCNPLDNEAILRILNVPKRGIGGKSVAAIIDYADKNGFSVLDGIYDADKLDLAAGAKSKINEFGQLLRSIVLDKENLTLTETVRSVINKTDFLGQFDDPTPENDDKKANVNEFLNSVEEFERLNPDASLSEYLNSITLSSDTDEINEGDFVTLATVHSVKGLEYACVFICGMDKEIFPIERAYSKPEDLEEERRLMYVAITRAKERLYITRAKSRFLYGSRRPTVASEFIDEISKPLGIVKSGQRGSDGYGYNKYRPYQNADDYGYERRSSGMTDRQTGNNFVKVYEVKSAVDRNARPISKGNGFTFGSSFINSQSARSDNSSGVDVSAYRAGMKIRHKKFGEGTIISVKNSGGETIGDIAFKGIGIKSLVLKLAPIEPID